MRRDVGISIRSPHTRGDYRRAFPCSACRYFNPLPSCEGRRRRRRQPSRICLHFNPLPSYEGRRGYNLLKYLYPISIHSPHTRGDWDINIPLLHGRISIHSPHARGDQRPRGRPAKEEEISIHSPHARGDVVNSGLRVASLHFNPLPSCEGRRLLHLYFYFCAYFNPLPSCEGRLLSPSTLLLISEDFNPLPSCEGRQHKPPKIHPNLRQLTQQNHDTPLFGALQAPFCGTEPDIRGAKHLGKP